MKQTQLARTRQWKSTFVCLFCLYLAGCSVDNAGDKSKTGALSSFSSPHSETTTYKSPKCPDEFRVKFETSKGNFVVEVKREWSPLGADRFHDLVSQHFYDDCRFFRVLDNFMAQIGINGDPETQAKWRTRQFEDDPVKQSNRRSWLSFATAGPGTRTCQIFINFKNNASLDNQGFSPFGKVIEGMEVVDEINDEYKEQPDQGKIQSQGNDYLNRKFPNLDYVITARIVPGESKKH